MKSSTYRLFKKHGWRIDRGIHNYIYFNWYYPYVKTVTILLKFVRHLTWFKPLKYVGEAAFNRYHGKVMNFEDTKKIFTIDEDLSVIGPENKRVVPKKYAYKFLFKETDHIAVMDCPCKKSAKNPVGPVNCCLAVGKDLADFWLDHGQKYNVRKISQQEAIDLIEDCRRQGHINQAFFKVATGGSTGVICNCHPSSCVSLIASKITREIEPNLQQYIESGYSVSFNQDKCSACGHCAEICPVDAITFNTDTRTYSVGNCIGCELCVEHCPGGALSLFQDSQKSLPLDLDMIRERGHC